MNPSFDPAILEIAGDRATLVSGLCPRCDAVMFPRRPVCAVCGSQTHDSHLPTVGVVRSYCRLMFAMPGAEPPVTLVRVKLSPHVTVQGVIDGAVDIGDRVALVTRQVTDGEKVCTSYGFAQASP